MKITAAHLRQIIRETIEESYPGSEPWEDAFSDLVAAMKKLKDQSDEPIELWTKRALRAVNK